jgi:hypothetical protein
MSNFSSITSKYVTAINTLLDSFMHNFELFDYPASFYTMNLHLLLHLSDRVAEFGPCYAASMFPFESQMKLPVFKNISSGTRGHLHQICEGFLMYKHLYLLASQNGSMPLMRKKFAEVSNICHISGSAESLINIAHFGCAIMVD